MAWVQSKELSACGPGKGKDWQHRRIFTCSFLSGFARSFRMRLCLLSSFAMLMLYSMHTGSTYSLLVDKKMQVMLSTYPFTTWNKNVRSQDHNTREVANNGGSMENEALFRLSAEDPNDEKEKKKIKLLLGVDSLTYSRYRWNPTRRMDHYADADPTLRGPRPRVEGWLLQLTSPRYATIWPKFHDLLAAWSRNKRFEPGVMKDLLLDVKTRIDLHSNSMNQQNLDVGRRAKSCAVIGNSGILLNRSYGAFIDSHEMVIRLNNARVSGYEQFVGAKTTLAFVNSHILHYCSRRAKCFCHPYGVNVPILVYLCQSQHLMDIAMCEPNHQAPLIVTDARFDNLCARLAKWYSAKHYVETTGNPIRQWDKDHGAADFHYSSGMQAIVTALGMCEKVNIFGFGKSSSAKHHYHTNQKAELSLHDYAAEYLFYDDLIFNRSSSIPFLIDTGMKIPAVEIYR